MPKIVCFEVIYMTMDTIYQKYENDVDRKLAITSVSTALDTLKTLGYRLGDFVWDEIINSSVKQVNNIYEVFYKCLIKLMVNKFSFEEISFILSITDKKLATLCEKIEDEQLLKLVDERINKYGGWENAKKSFIPAKDVYCKLGITQEMIDNAPDIDYEVSAL
jgi:hypothetical protein